MEQDLLANGFKNCGTGMREKEELNKVKNN